MNVKTNTFAALPATRANKIITDILAYRDEQERKTALFGARRQLIRSGQSDRAAQVAALMYKASRAKKEDRQAILDLGWSVLEKQRDQDIKVNDIVMTRFGMQRYMLQDLGVYGFSAEVLGSRINVAAHTKEEFVELMRDNPEQKQLLINWGKGLIHGNNALNAAMLADKAVLEARKQGILRTAQYARETTEFAGGLGATWSVEAYEAVMLARAGQDVKPGKLLRGVTDLIKEGISAAWFARQTLDMHDMYFIVEGKQTASGILYPREGGFRQHVSHDATDGQESYAGAEAIVLRFAGKDVTLGGAEMDAEELGNALSSARESFIEYADLLTENAQEMMSCFEGDVGIREGDVDYHEFGELKAAIEERLASKRKERQEFKATEKLQLLALDVLDVAMSMDIVNRRAYLKGFETEGAAFEAALRWAVDSRKTQREIAQSRAARDAAIEAEHAAKEAAYAATTARALEYAESKAQRDEERAAHARAAARLDAEMAAARKESK
ncbi:hypothetical protein VPH49_21895 [Pseudomonas luteola]|uniref:hypothetical protein n=1 Tax=Pseudomonas luteola TaxID=47886 RepID=UPI003A894300